VSGIGELLGGIAAVLWVIVAFVAVMVLRDLLARNGLLLSKLGVGPSGVTMEFTQAKIEQAISGADIEVRRAIGNVAKQSVATRLERHADLLRNASVLWVDDHPEYNSAIIDLLRAFGATIDTPMSNEDAFSLLAASKYDVVITDVGRDNEGPGSDLKGLELADEVYTRWNQRVLLFTARFSPSHVPGLSEPERLELVARVDRSVFARTNRADEALHYILDVLER
jgi:CheY-like chemotaxis protein